MPRVRMQSRRGGAHRAARNPGAVRPWLTELFGPPKESVWRQLLGLVIRARAELAVLIIVLVGYGVLVTHFDMTTTQAVITESVVIVVAVAIPGTRRALMSRFWSVMDRHRIRVCFVQTRTMTPDGSVPYLLWSSPIPVGERVRVWLRGGLSVNDISTITDQLAAACYASDARVTVSRKLATYVLIDIIRRDPLTGKRLIRAGVTQALPTGTDTLPTTKTGEKEKQEKVRPLPDRATLPVPAAPAEHPTVRAAQARTNGSHSNANGHSNGHGSANGNGKPARATAGKDTTTTTREPTPAVLGVDGTDVSDYV